MTQNIIDMEKAAVAAEGFKRDAKTLADLKKLIQQAAETGVPVWIGCYVDTDMYVTSQALDKTTELRVKQLETELEHITTRPYYTKVTMLAEKLDVLAEEIEALRTTIVGAVS